VQYDHILTDDHLREYCATLADAKCIAFDTEFVSEDTYRPDLCLIQVAADGKLAIIDPKACNDVTPFWEALAAPGHETIAHAGREELRFSLTAIQRPPNQLVDVQIAAGLIGLEYPAAYGTLIYKLLGKSLAKGETRTDWRKRPLSPQQLDYALLDVLYLEEIRNKLISRLEELNRRSWLDDELRVWTEGIETAEKEERWRRVSGASNLGRRALATVRELWRWRESEAQRRNSPPKRVLRDDLLVELSRRGTSDETRIRALRGMERSGLRKYIPELADAIKVAQALSDEECPARNQRKPSPQLNLLGQFLASALSGICREAEVAPSLVGSGQDVRNLIASRLGSSDAADPPHLASGWRAEVVGRKIDDLLEGKLAIAIADPKAEQPLLFEPRNP